MSPPVRRSPIPALPVRGLTRGLVAAGAVVLSLAVAGCTAASEPVAVPSPSSTSAPPAASPSASSPSASTSPSASRSPSSSPEASKPPDAVTIDITIADGKVTPSGERVNVEKGQIVIFNVTSDVDDEIHAHTAGDGVEIEVKAGRTVTAELVATDVGSFEVESHADGKIIVILNVR